MSYLCLGFLLLLFTISVIILLPFPYLHYPSVYLTLVFPDPLSLPCPPFCLSFLYPFPIPFLLIILPLPFLSRTFLLPLLLLLLLLSHCLEVICPSTMTAAGERVAV